MPPRTRILAIAAAISVLIHGAGFLYMKDAQWSLPLPPLEGPPEPPQVLIMTAPPPPQAPKAAAQPAAPAAPGVRAEPVAGQRPAAPASPAAPQGR
jgi:hypothetical protein